MAKREFFLSPETLDWLLEKNNPSVRYFTLTEILDRPEKDSDVSEAGDSIGKSPLVSKIFSQQRKQGCWEDPRKFYLSKYKSTVWQLLILAELGVKGDDARIQKACEFILDASQDRRSGGFSIGGTVKTGGARSGVIPCLSGNMVWSLTKFGRLKDPRVERGVRWITTYQRFDDGVQKPPKGWPYDKWIMCWGRHACHMGVVKSLKALSEIPVGERTPAVQESIALGVEYVLKHHVYKKSHDLDRVSKPGWLKFGFPLMYQTDVLEILGLLTKLGCKDGRMQEAVDLVISKQDERGRWKLENSYNGRFHANIERKSRESKWITLHALKALKRFYAVSQPKRRKRA